MIGRGTANIVESEQKLEEIERQLRARLERAKEVASTGSLEEPGVKTQEEQVSELEVGLATCRRWRCRGSTPP